MRLRAPRGFSLVELIIGLSIASVVIAGVVQFLGRTAGLTQEMKAIAARDALKAELKEHLQFPPNLATSLLDNPAFLACMQESTDGRSDCVSTSKDVPYPFRLLKASRKEAVVLAGPADAPVRVRRLPI